MGTEVKGGNSYRNISSSTLIKSSSGSLCGIFVASTTAGTVKLWDQTSAAAPILVNTHTILPGWNPMPFDFSNGLYITVAGTLDCTVSYS